MIPHFAQAGARPDRPKPSAPGHRNLREGAPAAIGATRPALS
jgi:hypothetical protein